MKSLALKTAGLLGLVTAFVGVLLLFLAPLCVHAQEVVAAATAPVVGEPDTTAEFVKFLLESLGGMKGASALVIAGIVVQILLKALSLPAVGNWFSKTSGNVKLLVVTGLTLVSGVIGLMTAGGLTFVAALMHSTTLAALMVFGNQLIQHFWPPKK